MVTTAMSESHCLPYLEVIMQIVRQHVVEPFPIFRIHKAIMEHAGCLVGKELSTVFKAHNNRFVGLQQTSYHLRTKESKQNVLNSIESKYKLCHLVS